MSRPTLIIHDKRAAGFRRSFDNLFSPRISDHARHRVRASILSAALSCCLLALQVRRGPTTTTRKPNVVFILADDLGWTDLACYGSGYYQTPNIDKMARDGIQFTSGYTCGPNCQPTRAALMSGQYGPRTGVYTVGSIDRFDCTIRPLVPVDNVPKLAPRSPRSPRPSRPPATPRACSASGTWARTKPITPWRGLRRGDRQHGPALRLQHQPQGRVPEGIYLADFLTDKAVDFISRHKDEPFLLCLPHFAVHSPWEAKQDLIDTFQGPAARRRARQPDLRRDDRQCRRQRGPRARQAGRAGAGREHAGHLLQRQRRRGRLRERSAW